MIKYIQVIDLEFNILYAIQNLRADWLDFIMKFLSFLGNGGQIWIITGITMLFFKKYRKCAISIGIALVLKEILGNMILKELVMRERPCWLDPTVELLVKSPTSFSFPSGHTFDAFAASVTIFLNHKKEGVLALVLGSLIAFSRMYLFVHFPTDILGGMFFGTGVAVLTYFVMQRWLKKQPKRA